MAAKILGQDILDYWKTWPLGDNFYVDEANLADSDDGRLCLASPNGEADEARPILPHQRYSVEGVLCWQGPLKHSQLEPPPRPLDTEIRRWAKQRQNHHVVVVVLPNTPEARAALEDFVKTRGWHLG